jgi:hypothetical protein
MINESQLSCYAKCEVESYTEHFYRISGTKFVVDLLFNLGRYLNYILQKIRIIKTASVV